MNLTVLLTCHNRREKTVRCLESLFAQQPLGDLLLDVVLVDDGSTDGTSEEVGRKFPSVKILTGPGNLFWCGGMRLAWKHAAKSDPDGFLWLNDDVVLHPGALATLYRLHQQEPYAILIGSCQSPVSGEHTYGGRRRIGAHPGKLTAIHAGAEPRRCDTFEGNIVWIPRSAYEKVGSMGEFVHAMGDIDYGYRAVKAGVPLLIAPGYLGQCSSNSQSGTWEDRTLPRAVRLKKLRGIKGLPPADWWKFCSRHGSWRAPLYFVTPVLRVLTGR